MSPVALLVAALLAAAALAFTAAPLLRRHDDDDARDDVRLDADSRLQARLEELRDLDLDHDMGRIRDADHAALRAELVADAARLAARRDLPPAAGSSPSVARRRRRGPGLFALAVFGLAAAGPTAAADLTVVLHNGTSGAPGDADEVVLFALTEEMTPVGEAFSVQERTLLTGIPPADDADYLLQARRGGTSYFRLLSAEDVAGGQVTLTVYDGTTDAGALVVERLTLVLRLFPGRLETTYIVTLDNASEPPKALVASEVPAFSLPVPGGADAVVEMSLGRGSLPLPAEAKPDSAAGRVGPDRALLPGRSRLEVRAEFPYPGSFILPLDASAPILGWRVLTLPADMDLAAPGLVDAGLDPETGFRQWQGGTIPPGAPFRLVLRGGTPLDPDAPAGGGARIVTLPPASARRAPWLAPALVAPLALLALGRRRIAASAGPGDAR